MKLPKNNKEEREKLDLRYNINKNKVRYRNHNVVKIPNVSSPYHKYMISHCAYYSYVAFEV